MTTNGNTTSREAEVALYQAEMRRTNFGPLDADCHECLTIAYQRVIAIALVGVLSHLETEGLCHQNPPPSAG